MTAAVGRSLELYYIDGRPDGMLTAEMFNWTGHVLMSPRTQIATALARPEARYTGVYLLLGEQDGEPRAYVGEGEDIATRIKQHDVKKEWWTSAILVTTAANKLNKAHVRYLEARLIAQAKTIGRLPLDNETNPQPPTLSEADIAKMEAFLENLFVVLPALRVDMFIQRSRPSVAEKPSPREPVAAGPGASRFMIESRKHGMRAEAVLLDGEFIVQAGSLAREKWEGQGTSEESNYGRLHAELRRAGVLVPDGALCRFAQNYAFSSTSAAAAVIMGRATSGPTSWKEAVSGLTYKDWEARQLQQLPAAAA